MAVVAARSAQRRRRAADHRLSRRGRPALSPDGRYRRLRPPRSRAQRALVAPRRRVRRRTRPVHRSRSRRSARHDRLRRVSGLRVHARRHAAIVIATGGHIPAHPGRRRPRRRFRFRRRSRSTSPIGRSSRSAHHRRSGQCPHHSLGRLHARQIVSCSKRSARSGSPANGTRAPVGETHASDRARRIANMRRRSRPTASGSPTSPGTTRPAGTSGRCRFRWPAALPARPRRGAQPQQLTRIARQYANPSWSPDGSKSPSPGVLPTTAHRQCLGRRRLARHRLGPGGRAASRTR